MLQLICRDKFIAAEPMQQVVLVCSAERRTTKRCHTWRHFGSLGLELSRSDSAWFFFVCAGGYAGPIVGTFRWMTHNHILHQYVGQVVARYENCSWYPLLSHCSFGWIFSLERVISNLQFQCNYKMCYTFRVSIASCCLLQRMGFVTSLSNAALKAWKLNFLPSA